MVNSKGWKAAPLALAALLVLSGCDDEEEKAKVVEVEIEEGTELKIKIKEKESDDMIVVGELMLTVGVVLWALFGPGATRRYFVVGSDHR